uniref:Uncharacterized protein n=1 Tax=Arundo donax TaxID=35708 RepID=A0A0A9DFX2_ARUDO
MLTKRSVSSITCERYSIFLKSLSVRPCCVSGMLLMISSCSAFAFAKMSGFSWRKTVAHMVMWPEDSWPALRYMMRMSMISSSSSLRPCSSSTSISRSIMSTLLDLVNPLAVAARRSSSTPCSTDTSRLRALSALW